MEVGVSAGLVWAASVTPTKDKGGGGKKKKAQMEVGVSAGRVCDPNKGWGGGGGVKVVRGSGGGYR